MDDLQFEQWEMGIMRMPSRHGGRQAQMMKSAEELCELAAAHKPTFVLRGIGIPEP